MGKNLDLTSREWRDLIFEGKNKEYGAYYLRATSNKRHLRALIIVAVSVIILASLPFVFKFVGSLLPEEDLTSQTVVEMADIELPPEEEEEEIPQEIELPPQEVLDQVAFVVPTIADVAPPEEVQATNRELLESEATVSAHTVEGTQDIIPDELTELVEEVIPEKPVIHTYVAEMPKFPGGDAALAKFLSDNIEYPRADLEMGTQGTVVVQFTVEPSGKLTDFKVVRKVSPGLDAEALRVVKMMPAWSPGRQNGQAVYVQFNQPVAFRIQAAN